MIGYVRVAAVCSLGLALGACGNTISGLGKDISSTGYKIVQWQNEVNVSSAEKDNVVQEKVDHNVK